MKVRYTTADKSLVFEFEHADTKAIFDELSSIQEIFEQEKCGNCDGVNFKFSKRNVDNKYVYRELVCKMCHHRLSLGQQQKDGSLFPQRKDKQGNYKPKNGWHVWTPNEDIGEAEDDEQPTKRRK
jgi:hypothetical protein